MKYPNLAGVKTIALDIETKDPDIKELGPGPRREGSYILGVGIATEDKEWYFPLKHMDTENNINPVHFYEWLKTLKDKNLIGANIMYDLDYLQYEGFMPKEQIHDVQFAEPLIDENLRKYNLESLAQRYLHIGKYTDEILEYCEENFKGTDKKSPHSNLWRMPSELVGKYCMMDCRRTYDVFKKQYDILCEQDLLPIYEIETGLIPVLLQMRKTGVRIDVEKLENLDIEYSKLMEKEQRKIKKLSGIDIQIGAAKSKQAVFEKFGYKYSLTTKGQPCFDHEAMENYLFTYDNPEIIKNMMDLAGYTYIYNRYIKGIKKFLVEDRLHTEFNPLRSDSFGTVTGRFSSTRPALQNMPARNEKFKKDIRTLFLPEKNHKWIKMDYSQEEMVIFAHYARGGGSDKLREMYTKDENADMYKIFAATANKCKPDQITKETRQLFKSIALGIMYGMGTDKLGRTLKLIKKEHPGAKIVTKYWKNIYAHNPELEGIEQHEEYIKEYIHAWKLMREYHKALPCLKDTANAAQKMAETRGYVKTILGRRRRFKDSRFAYRAFNAVDQGSGGDIMKKAMVDAYKEGLFDVLPLHLTVHDELDISMPAGCEKEILRLKEIMENTVELKVPLRVDIETGNNWGELEDFKGEV